VFENGVLKKIFGCKRGEGVLEWGAEEDIWVQEG
jgi:hypothetical protein